MNLRIAHLLHLVIRAVVVRFALLAFIIITVWKILIRLLAVLIVKTLDALIVRRVANGRLRPRAPVLARPRDTVVALIRITQLIVIDAIPSAAHIAFARTQRIVINAIPRVAVIALARAQVIVVSASCAHTVAALTRHALCYTSITATLVSRTAHHRLTLLCPGIPVVAVPTPGFARYALAR
jgi:hypothetical protein